MTEATTAVETTTEVAVIKTTVVETATPVKGNVLQFTVKTLAEKLGVEYPTAIAIVKYMQANGKATEVGKEKSASGRGKPSAIFEVVPELTISFR